MPLNCPILEGYGHRDGGKNRPLPSQNNGRAGLDQTSPAAGWPDDYRAGSSGTETRSG